MRTEEKTADPGRGTDNATTVNAVPDWPAVSVVVPMYNARRHIAAVVRSLLAQDYPGAIEVIVVNDGSTDGSGQLLADRQRQGLITVIDQPNRGAVAATNAGFARARHGIICSIDADVVLETGWMRKIVERLRDPSVGAVQGYCRTAAGSPAIARLMGYDVERRFDAIRGEQVTQLGTANTAYRRQAWEKAGPFDAAFTYGYDNDMSYRLQRAGYRLLFRKDARCDHYWKETLSAYVRQQYFSAYGRLSLVSRHRDRAGGDSVSGLRMIVQAPLTLVGSCLLAAGIIGIPWGWHRVPLLLGAALITALLLDRAVFALEVAGKHREWAVAGLPALHLLRNAVWCWAMVRWGIDRVTGKQ